MKRGLLAVARVAGCCLEPQAMLRVATLRLAIFSRCLQFATLQFENINSRATGMVFSVYLRFQIKLRMTGDISFEQQDGRSGFTPKHSLCTGFSIAPDQSEDPRPRELGHIQDGRTRKECLIDNVASFFPAQTRLFIDQPNNSRALLLRIQCPCGTIKCLQV